MTSVPPCRHLRRARYPAGPAAPGCSEELSWRNQQRATGTRAFRLHPNGCCVTCAAMAAEDVLISDVGAHKLWIARLYPCERPNTCIISNGFASMGIALPGAVAAKLLFPHRRVVAVTGDGGFLMNSQELETTVRLGLPIVILVCNDGGYGLIGWKQRARFGREAFVKFGNPDFVRYAESFGATGYRVETAEDLPYVLQAAFGQDGPVVIDCPVDYRENLALTDELGELISGRGSRVGAGGRFLGNP